jgi:hypothetical protein
MEETEKKKNWFVRHKVLTVIIVFIAIIVIGASASGNNTTNKSSSNSQTQTNNSKENTPTATEKKDVTPKVGDVTKLGDREFIVNSVRRSGAFDYNTPKAGKEYVIVNVTIRNLGKDEIDYNPYDFKVQDANGAQESETFAILDDSLNSGTLAAGGKVTGSIPFEVPIGDKALLIFKPSFWGNQRVVVDLGDK